MATGPETPVPPGELPPQVDPRQLTPFAAAWTLAVIKNLAEAGAESITLYETTGWRGVMERDAGSPLPARFPSQPGQVFPLYYSIAEVSGFGGGEAIVSHSSDSLRVESLALTKKGWACVYLANMTAESQTTQVGGFRRATHQHELDWSLATVWMFDPHVVMREKGPELFPAKERQIEVELSPLRIMRLELEM